MKDTVINSIEELKDKYEELKDFKYLKVKKDESVCLIKNPYFEDPSVNAPHYYCQGCLELHPDECHKIVVDTESKFFSIYSYEFIDYLDFNGGDTVEEVDEEYYYKVINTMDKVGGLLNKIQSEIWAEEKK